jgi:xanthine dehydrogenase accessory factor
MTGQRPPHDDDWSVPETAVMGNIRDALADGRDGVVATIAAVEGSAYRRPGAKMLVDDEHGIGSITAGCLEDEVVAIAQEVLDTGRPRVERFDLTDDEEWGLGLGCNGVIDLLLEPLDDRFATMLDRYAAGEDGLALTVVDPGGAETDLTVGDRAYAPDGDLSEVEGLPGWLVDDIADRAGELYERGRSTTVPVEGPPGSSGDGQESGDVNDEESLVFVDPVRAPPELYVFGSGNDVAPVTELASKADFRVSVVAFRGGKADDDAFPHANRVVSASAPRVGDELEFDDETYAVVMSHNFVDDRMAAESLLDTETPYIGLMGPESRFERLRDELAQSGRELTEADLERLYAPIGLDLGGGAPYQIAMSIVTEVLAVHNDRQPRHLRERKSPIHGRVDAE